MPDFVTVAKTDELASGAMKLVQVAGEDVVVANVDGAYHAFGNECTHQGGDLSEGELEGEEVTCPLHNTIFNVRTGEAVIGPGMTAIPTYAVRVEGGDIQVGPRTTE